MGRVRGLGIEGVGLGRKQSGSSLIRGVVGIAAVMFGIAWVLYFLSCFTPPKSTVVAEIPKAAGLTDDAAQGKEKWQGIDSYGGESDVGHSSSLRRLFKLGLDDPGELVRVLEEEDPLKVSVDSPASFVCPPEDERFSEPDMRDHAVEREFQQGRGFVYYQHLRKAGGTGFCEMAQRNMDTRTVPAYHCMPDNKGALATPPWSKQDYLLNEVSSKGYRIIANEWDAFPGHHMYLPGAVFATTFRHPVDRWYSQYRFEHVERRDGGKSAIAPFQRWYNGMKGLTMGDNYYVKTFSGLENMPDHLVVKAARSHNLLWTYRKFDSWGQKVRWRDFEQAVDTLGRFNLLLVLDFVDDEMWALEEALGWKEARKQILPHEKQAKREDKKSISAKEALPAAVWQEVLQQNVFDLLLFHWAKRMYLERSACRTQKSEKNSTE